MPGRSHDHGMAELYLLRRQVSKDMTANFLLIRLIVSD